MSLGGPPGSRAVRHEGPAVNSFKTIAILVTALWLLGCVGVGTLWMSQEYDLVEKDNGDGTVTFRDGPRLKTSTKGEFFTEALLNTLVVVFLFPTLPYLLVMLAVGLVWLLARREARPVDETEGWGATGDGASMAEKLARMRDKPSGPG
jgi:hypothetical protein